MAVNLIIDGKQFELAGAATEETLSRLVEKMESKQEGFAKETKEAREGLTKMANGSGTATLKLGGLAEKSEDASRELGEAADAASSFSSRAGNFVKKLIDGATEVVKFGSSTAGVGYNLETLGKNTEGVLSAFPKLGALAGATGGAMVAFSANLQDTFRGLSSTGAMFTNSFFELEKVAASSFISLAQMTSIVRSNSEALATFGGTARLGAKRFSEILIEAQAFRTEFRNLGLSGEDAAEMLAIFTAANARNANFATLSTRQQAAAGAQFAKEMTLLASLTGQDRKKLAEEMAAKQRRSDVEMKLSRMEVNAANRARAAFGTLEEQFGANSPVLEAFRAKFLGQDVVIGNPAANMLLAGTMPLGAALNETAVGLANGNLSIADFVKKISESAKPMQDVTRGFEELAPFSEISMNFTDINAGLIKFVRMNDKVNKEFAGNFEKFIAEGGPVTSLDKASKAIVGAGMLAEDIGKNTRLLFNSLTEKTVTGIATGIEKLKKALGEATSEELDKMRASAVGATGALEGFAKALKQYAATIAKTAGTTLDDIAKVGSVVATATAPAGTKVATGLAGATKAMGTFLGKLPLIGSLITGGITAAETGSVVEGAGAGAGSLGGGAAGAFLGSLILPGIGTVVGGILGSFLGEAVGQGVTSGGERFGTLGKIGNFFGFEEGGIVRQPTLAMIGEGQSDEAVIPLDNNRNVPVNMNMGAIEELSRKIDRLAEAATGGGYDPTMTMEMRKFNRNAEKMVRLLQ